jgi:hypothetical protein
VPGTGAASVPDVVSILSKMAWLRVKRGMTLTPVDVFKRGA